MEYRNGHRVGWFNGKTMQMLVRLSEEKRESSEDWKRNSGLAKC